MNPISSPENTEEKTHTVANGIAALVFNDRSTDPQTSLDLNGALDDVSNRSSMTTEENYTMRPYVDPGLVIQKHKKTRERWLGDFVSPASAPQSPYSPISQAVKKLLPERTACRLGKEI